MLMLEKNNKFVDKIVENLVIDRKMPIPIGCKLVML